MCRVRSETRRLVALGAITFGAGVAATVAYFRQRQRRRTLHVRSGDGSARPLRLAVLNPLDGSLYNTAVSELRASSCVRRSLPNARLLRPIVPIGVIPPSPPLVRAIENRAGDEDAGRALRVGRRRERAARRGA